MSVVGVANERQDRRTSGEKEDGSRWYVRVYLVKTDNQSDGGAIVSRATDLPQRGDFYATDTESDERAIVISRDPRQTKKAPYLWDVTIRYETRTDEQRELDPFSRQISMSFQPDEREVPVVGVLLSTITITPDSTKIYKEPVRNSLAMPYRTQPLVDTANGVLTITQNEDSFSPAWAMEWQNAVNSDDWSGAVPRQLKLKTPTCAGSQTETVDEEEVKYYPVVYQMHFKKEGHDLRLLDEGPSWGNLALVGNTTVHSTVYVSTAMTEGQYAERSFETLGRPYIGKLDGHGRPLKCNPGMRGTVYTTLSSTVDGVFLQFKHHTEKPFAELGLPEEFI